ncbi:AMP-dependent synthetase/ligase [Virgisporangium aurantiacum]|uniref:Acyl-CoA synthetase n=1 Tax=Virgisporangium aurantiacum TaxID=175570 RepID=A0A8J3ZJM1_9ACTN|nr:AMP-dependent synthetase/ligase [Virgisporangium aurantiacum]GIJ63195.1 long-chain-fatty-acid--CoA ligase [Virgisporangium aurantiacum]
MTPTTVRGDGTMAGLLPEIAARYPDRTAVVAPDGGVLTFAELLEQVTRTALGLIDRGLSPGDRVGLLCTTRPEWTVVDYAVTMAGGVVVPVYPSNAPGECAWILAHAGVTMVVCEDADQLAKVRAVESQLPRLRVVVTVDPAPGHADLEEIQRRGLAGAPGELAARAAAVTADDLYTVVYTSGTTGPPKGCVLTHGGYRAGIAAVTDREVLRDDDVVYLFLPLAHSFARLMQHAAFADGAAVAYGNPQRVVEDLAALRPTFLPAAPRLFEKLYRWCTEGMTEAQLEHAVSVGARVQDLRVTGLPVPDDLRRLYDPLDAALFARMRTALGGRLRQASSGAAPISPAILRFFWACGIPVMEGYGMTETATAVTASTPEHHRFGTVGRAVPGVQLAVAVDGELLVRAPSMFSGYLDDPAATAEALDGGWLRTGDLGELDAEGYLRITGRKKEIIITAGGKNLTPANLENDVKRSPLVSHAVMHGDGRPYPVLLVTLDPDAAMAWARWQGIAVTGPADLAQHPVLLAEIRATVDRANAEYARVEQVKKFVVLGHDLTVEAGELTATLKVRRDVVNTRYAAQFDELYRA